MSGPFLQHARDLIELGYSPLPIWPGKKSPIPNEWNTARNIAISNEEIEQVAARYPDAGLGVAGGFCGLVPIDVDTDEEDTRAEGSQAHREPRDDAQSAAGRAPTDA